MPGMSANFGKPPTGMMQPGGMLPPLPQSKLPPQNTTIQPMNGMGIRANPAPTLKKRNSSYDPRDRPPSKGQTQINRVSLDLNPGPIPDRMDQYGVGTRTSS